MVHIDAKHTKADKILLDTLRDVSTPSRVSSRSVSPPGSSTADSGYASEHDCARPPTSYTDALDKDAIRRADALLELQALTDPQSNSFEPTVATTWDLGDIPLVPRSWISAYVKWAQQFVRKPSDVVFVTHTLTYIATLVPSAAWLFFIRFSYWHACLHLIYAVWCAGSFTLMMHNHLHQNGLLVKRWPLSILDHSLPYMLYPLHGHTWNSYYYHHKQMHHVEGNGPNDLSSTIRYQRDSLYDFTCYVSRFLFLCWLELPMYFWRHGKRKTAMKVAFWEVSSYAFMASALYHNKRAATFILILPFVILRLGLMIGNWGQHCFVDEQDPTHDFRSSVTLIDVASNRFCFNDGYHTSHHLNPQRHWREHPREFLRRYDDYATGKALTFWGIDYLMVTVRLLSKDYDTLARHLLPMGEQISMTHEERVELLMSKTRKFSEADIARIFGAGEKSD